MRSDEILAPLSPDDFANHRPGTTVVAELGCSGKDLGKSLDKSRGGQLFLAGRPRKEGLATLIGTRGHSTSILIRAVALFYVARLLESTMCGGFPPG
jgi:hypothetical protein